MHAIEKVNFSSKLLCYVHVGMLLRKREEDEQANK